MTNNKMFPLKLTLDLRIEFAQAISQLALQNIIQAFNETIPQVAFE